MAEEHPPQPTDMRNRRLPEHRVGNLRGLVANFGVLFSGNAVATILGFVSWMLTARALGVELFGVLVLIQTYALTIDAFVNFQSWQLTIRYGAIAIERHRDDELADVFKFGLLIDLGSALTGTALALAGAYWFCHWQGWDGTHLLMVMLFSLSIAFNLHGTPTAVLRLFNRFGWLAWHQTLAAAGRVALLLIVYFFTPSLWGFFLAWLISEVAGHLLLLAMGWRELHRRGLSVWRQGRARNAIQRHRDIWRFAWTTNLNKSAKYGGQQVDILLLGMLISPAAAGIVKIIKLFVKALGALAVPLDQSVYPDLARLWTRGQLERFKSHLLRVGLLGGALGLAIWVGLLVSGPWLLTHVFGEEYRQAYLPLLVYLAPSSLALFAIGFRAGLLSMGKVRTIFVSTLIGYGIYFVVMPVLAVQMGVLGAAIAQFVPEATWVLVSAYVIVRTLRARERTPAPSLAAEA